MSAFSPPRALRMRSLGGPSVWLEFSPLAQLTGSINLGQGAPGWGSPGFVKKAISEAAESDAYCQYAPSAGAHSLIAEVMRVYAPKLIPPSDGSCISTELSKCLKVVVTVGASQAISLICSSFLSEGDEVVLIEPAFDIYTGAVRMAGATPVYVPLRVHPRAGDLHLSSKDLVVDMDELAACLSKSTRLLILNSPHNPTGKVFSRAEMLAIANILDERAPHCVVLSDEVYEHIVFSTCTHIPFASVSRSAFERTISVYSAGKTFSATGLKVGWAIGTGRLIHEICLAQQYTSFAVCHAGQAAIASSLQIAERHYEGFSTYYVWLRSLYETKRDLLVDALRNAGMRPIIPEGTFFVCARVPEQHMTRRVSGIPTSVREMVDDGRLLIDNKTVDREDYNASRNLVIQQGVVSIPNSAFFSEEHIGTSFLSDCVLRFAFCHPDSVLKEAASRLRCQASVQ